MGRAPHAERWAKSAAAAAYRRSMRKRVNTWAGLAKDIRILEETPEMKSEQQPGVLGSKDIPTGKVTISFEVTLSEEATKQLPVTLDETLDEDAWSADLPEVPWEDEQ